MKNTIYQLQNNTVAKYVMVGIVAVVIAFGAYYILKNKNKTKNKE